MLATSHSVLWAQKSKDVFSDFQKKVEHVEKQSIKDPETFLKNVKELETYCSKLKDPVQQSVAHALLASSYAEMRQSPVYRRSQDITDEFRKKKGEHQSRVLDDCEALANAKAKDYQPMVMMGADADLFDGGMLSVMVDYVAMKDDKKFSCMSYEKAFLLYRQRGNLNAPVQSSIPHNLFSAIFPNGIPPTSQMEFRQLPK